MESRDHAACEATRDALARELADVRRELAEAREELLSALRRIQRWRRAAEIAFHAGHPPKEKP